MEYDDVMPAGMPWKRIMAIIGNPPRKTEKPGVYYTPQVVVDWVREHNESREVT